MCRPFPARASSYCHGYTTQPTSVDASTILAKIRLRRCSLLIEHLPRLIRTCPCPARHGDLPVEKYDWLTLHLTSSLTRNVAFAFAATSCWAAFKDRRWGSGFRLATSVAIASNTTMSVLFQPLASARTMRDLRPGASRDLSRCLRAMYLILVLCSCCCLLFFKIHRVSLGPAMLI